ncbi:MAG: phosphoglucosamine mutase [Candidatus Rokuibacteriota bacterium]|nr:MAG: phosphoglucosamine mutase [Candidatus Rokubacteria bacterium]
MARLFGTDGIRGVANAEPLTTELAFRLGRQLVATLLEHHGLSKARLVVGRDTRLSGPMLEGALVSGALSAGADVFTVGVLPTPGIAYLTRALDAQGGVVLSASHNPFEDNGIKIFSSEGSKFPDSWESEIEARLNGRDVAPKPTGKHVGRLVHYDRAEVDYIAHARQTFPFDLAGLTVTLDCAHGATYRVAPKLFRALGARVAVHGARPNGLNINMRSGALHAERLTARMRTGGADIGLAFDGDGDRLIALDETGEVRDGDYVLAICGRHLAAHRRLKTGVVITTVMANLGLDKALGQAGIRTIKTQVGDRYVLEEMIKTGANLGGEQSGHLLFLDHTTTGDGIVSALQLLAVLRETGQPLSALSKCLTKFPQILINVKVREKPPLESIPGLAERQASFEREMASAGRILLRYSGTENLARVMVEYEDGDRVQAIAADLSQLIKAAIGA